MDDIQKMRTMWNKRSPEGQRLRDEEAKRLIREGVAPRKVGGRLAKVLDGAVPRRPSEAKGAPFEVRALSELQSLRRMVGVVDGRMLALRLEIKRIADALGCPDSLAHVRASKGGGPDEPREEQAPSAPPEARPTPSVG